MHGGGNYCSGWGALESTDWNPTRRHATMLTRIQLANFKCFDQLDLDLSNLNLLCGMNSSGKSTVIQALVLLHQSQRSGETLNGSLQLRGELIDLGPAEEVLSKHWEGKQTEFSLTYDQSPYPPHLWEVEIEFRPSPGGREVRMVDDDMISGDFRANGMEDRPPFSEATVYVGSERIGPRTSYQIPESRSSGDTTFGRHSEYALHNLLNSQKLGEEHKSRSIDLDSDESDEPVDLVNRWLQKISPGVEFKATASENDDTVRARFQYQSTGDGQARPLRPINVGFGLTYVLPVIIALLSPKGTLCLIENPEAHIHPKGQSALGELAARAAVDGVQVVAETHSDHFMDGVRIAVRDGVIPPEATRFHNFTLEDGVSRVTSPEINEDGRLSEWPEGFFDQADFNLDRLLAPKDRD